MPWGKLDDSLYDHPKLDALGKLRLPCVGLWAVAISWSNRRLTDGHIPLDRIRLLGGTRGQAEALVAAGLFDQDDEGYRIHDFGDFNDTRDAVLVRRAAAAERQRQSRVSREQSHGESHRKSQRDSHSDSSRESQRESLGDLAPGGARSRVPGPTRPESESPQRVAKAVGGTAARGTAVATAEDDEVESPWLPVEKNGAKP